MNHYTPNKLTEIIQTIMFGTIIGMILPAYAAESPNTATKNNYENTLPVIKVSAEDEKGLNAKNIFGALGSKKILDTPYSVTVVTSDDITKRGANTIGQIFITDPAVYSQSSAMATDWWGTSIRGIGTGNYYVDGIPMALNWGGNFPIEAAESVTALKGLTGFMYGFGTPGGALSYELKRPTSTPKTSLQLGYRHPGMFNTLVDTSNYFNSIDLGYRFVIGGDKGETYNGAEQNKFITSLALDKKIFDNLLWTANITYENVKTEHEPPIFRIYTASALPKVTYNYDNLIVDNAYYKNNTFMASTGLDWKINENWSLKYQFGHTRKEHQSNLVFGYLLNPIGDYKGYLYQFAGLQESNMNQATLTGKFSTTSVKHELVTGLGYTTTEYTKGTTSYWNNDYSGNLYENQIYTITHIPDYSFKPTDSKISQTYLFFSDTVKFNEQWQAILGARHTYYDKEDLDFNATTDSGYSTKTTTPTIALLYKPVPEATLYASYVESLESGSVVGSSYANSGEILDALVSKQYEIGAKYDISFMSLTAALFNMQRGATMDSTVGTLTYLTQDGRTNYTGIELNANYKPMDNLKIGLGTMYIHASIDNASLANKSIEGNRPAGTAKWSGTANAEYDISAVEGLSVHGNVRYNGSTYAENANLLKVPAYKVVNVGATYKFKLSGKDTTFNANINNLFNEKYWATSGTWASLGESFNGVLSLKIDW